MGMSLSHKLFYRHYHLRHFVVCADGYAQAVVNARLVEIPDVNSLVAQELENVLSNNNDPEKEFLASELHRAVQVFLKKLPAKERNVFIRRYFYFETGKEIAEKYGLSENNINVILNRVRRKLRDNLLKEGYL